MIVPACWTFAKPLHTPEPTVIGDGVATTGTIPRQLFTGKTDGQALVVNVAGEGLTLIVGCNHQSLANLVPHTREVFGLPVHGVIGGLHYPYPSGRVELRGQLCLRLAAEATWTEFDRVAPLVIRALNAMLGEKLDGVDVSLWEADIDDAPFYFAWDRWMGLSLEPRGPRLQKPCRA